MNRQKDRCWIQLHSHRLYLTPILIDKNKGIQNSISIIIMITDLFGNINSYILFPVILFYLCINCTLRSYSLSSYWRVHTVPIRKCGFLSLNALFAIQLTLKTCLLSSTVPSTNKPMMFGVNVCLNVAIIAKPVMHKQVQEGLNRANRKMKEERQGC